MGMPDPQAPERGRDAAAERRPDQTIRGLAADLARVRRLPGPGLLLARWVLLAGLVVAAGVAWFGPRADLAERLAGGLDLGQLLLAGAVAVLAALAGFNLALPDRSRRWALLPVPALVAWLAVMGFGCVRDFLHFGPDGLQLGVSWACFSFILGFGVPLAGAMLWFARHAALIRPGPVAALCGLSAAAFANIGLTLTHAMDSAVMVLVWHGLAAALVTAGVALAGPRLLRAAA